MNGIQQFIRLRTWWRFGRGCVADVGGIVSTLGHKALVVTGRTALRANGVTETVVGLLEAAGVQAVVCDGVTSNPRTSEVDTIVERQKRFRADVIVGLGGGSAMDAAKAARYCIAHGVDASEALQRVDGTGVRRAPSLVAIPTTIGTGAELSAGAVLTDVQRGVKDSIRGPLVQPDAAIVDPDLCATLPRPSVRVGAFDALSHAIETYASKRAQPFSRALSLRAAAMIMDGVRALDSDPGASMEQLCYASSLMGLNLAVSSTCLPHRIQYALGGRSDGVHALGVAAVYPAWAANLARHCPEVLAPFWPHLFGHDLAGSADEDAVYRAVQGLTRWFGVDGGVAAFGVTGANVDEYVDLVRGHLEDDPGYRGRQTIRRILLGSLRSAGASA